MKHLKKLTIIIPCYNVEKYLDKTLSSMTTIKKLNECEIIVVNDGSNDGTLDIANMYLKQYPESIKVINKENGGHGSAVNAGVKKSNGQYICVVDGDDWIKSETLDLMIERMSSLDVDLIITNYCTVNIDTGKIENKVFSGIEDSKIHDIKQINIEKHNFTMPTLCYNKKILNKSKLKLQEKTYYVDEEFCLLPFSEVKTVYYIKEIFYYYRIGNINQSISSQNQVKKIEDKIKVAKKLLENYKIKDLDNEIKGYYKMRISALINSIYLIMLIYNENKTEGREFVRSFRRFLKNNYYNFYKITSRKYFIFKVLSICGFKANHWNYYQGKKYDIVRKMG